jgi:hypothetical protein
MSFLSDGLAAAGRLPEREIASCMPIDWMIDWQLIGLNSNQLYNQFIRIRDNHKLGRKPHFYAVNAYKMSVSHLFLTKEV